MQGRSLVLCKRRLISSPVRLRFSAIRFSVLGSARIPLKPTLFYWSRGAVPANPRNQTRRRKATKCCDFATSSNNAVLGLSCKLFVIMGLRLLACRRCPRHAACLEETMWASEQVISDLGKLLGKASRGVIASEDLPKVDRACMRYGLSN